MAPAAREHWLGGAGGEPFVGVYGQREATFEREGTEYTLEDLAFAPLDLDGVDASPTPFDLYMHLPLGLAHAEDGDGYRTVGPGDVDSAVVLTLEELLCDRYGVYGPVALGMGEMAGVILGMATTLVPVVLLSATFVRDSWDDIAALVNTLGGFYAGREEAIETTIAVDCPDGRRVSVEYAGDPGELRSILGELELARERARRGCVRSRPRSPERIS